MTEHPTSHPAEAGLPKGRGPLSGPELRRLVRALGGLFWGLPLALVTGVLTAQTPLLAGLQFGPVLAACGLLTWSFHLLARVQPKQPRWQAEVEGARVLGVVLCGLAPFLHWFQLAPSHGHYAGCALGFLLAALAVLARTSRLLVTAAGWIDPDRLQTEARHFRGAVLPLVTCVFVVSIGMAVLNRSPLGPRARASLLPLLARVELTSVLMLVASVALNMAMAWKLKEAVLRDVFEKLPSGAVALEPASAASPSGAETPSGPPAQPPAGA